MPPPPQQHPHHTNTNTTTTTPTTTTTTTTTAPTTPPSHHYHHHHHHPNNTPITPPRQHQLPLASCKIFFSCSLFSFEMLFLMPRAPASMFLATVATTGGRSCEGRCWLFGGGMVVWWRHGCLVEAWFFEKAISTHFNFLEPSLPPNPLNPSKVYPPIQSSQPINTHFQSSQPINTLANNSTPLNPSDNYSFFNPPSPQRPFAAEKSRCFF